MRIKEMKLTKPVQAAASQLIRRVGRLAAGETWSLRPQTGVLAIDTSVQSPRAGKRWNLEPVGFLAY
jgi:hypothetical protein